MTLPTEGSPQDEPSPEAAAPPSSGIAFNPQLRDTMVGMRVPEGISVPPRHAAAITPPLTPTEEMRLADADAPSLRGRLRGLWTRISSRIGRRG